MKNRPLLITLAAVALLAAAGFATWRILAPSEPRFDGRTVSGWLREMEPTNEADRITAGEAAIQNLGTNSLPILVRHLADESSPLRRSAWKAFRLLGPTALPATPLLIDLLDDPDPKARFNAAMAISAIGSPAAAAAPKLAERLSDPDHNVRWCAAAAIGKLAPRSASSATALIPAIDDPHPFVRRDALEAVSAFDPETFADHLETLRNAIEPALRDDEAEVRLQALRTLNHLHLASPSLVPRLVTALQDKEADVRAEAALALSLVQPPPQQAVPALLKVLTDPSVHVRNHVAHALVTLDPEAAAKVGLSSSPLQP